MRRAVVEDVPVLASLMEEFDAEAGYELNRALAAEAFEAILSNESLGRVWILQDGGRPAHPASPGVTG